MNYTRQHLLKTLMYLRSAIAAATYTHQTPEYIEALEDIRSNLQSILDRTGNHIPLPGSAGRPPHP